MTTIKKMQTLQIKPLLMIIFIMATLNALAQHDQNFGTPTDDAKKYRVSIPVIPIPQMIEKSWNDRTHTQHIELHVKRTLDEKNIVGVKFATWRLFQPMGIQWWDGLLDKIESESEFYPGHVRETGVGVSYQRMLWKGLFTTVEVLPLFQTYLDEHGDKIGNGFKLYNSIHLGYHIALGKKKRFFIEPQVHSQFWIFDNNVPEGFEEQDDKWANYFLFEPNLYIGIKI